MPSTMIHLLTAYEVKKEAPDLFWVGNFAPDYINDRVEKDKIHFRDCSDRIAALYNLKKQINMNNPFEEGWILHLFVDNYWDKEVISLFKENHKKANESSDWFLKYRNETSIASFSLFHTVSWSKKIWAQILKADLSQLNSTLPAKEEDMKVFIERVYKRHSENKPEPSLLYTEEMIADFAKRTAEKYRKWIEE